MYQPYDKEFDLIYLLNDDEKYLLSHLICLIYFIQDRTHREMILDLIKYFSFNDKQILEITFQNNDIFKYKNSIFNTLNDDAKLSFINRYVIYGQNKFNYKLMIHDFHMSGLAILPDLFYLFYVFLGEKGQKHIINFIRFYPDFLGHHLKLAIAKINLFIKEYGAIIPSKKFRDALTDRGSISRICWLSKENFIIDKQDFIKFYNPSPSMIRFSPRKTVAFNFFLNDYKYIINNYSKINHDILNFIGRFVHLKKEGYETNIGYKLSGFWYGFSRTHVLKNLYLTYAMPNSHHLCLARLCPLDNLYVRVKQQ